MISNRNVFPVWHECVILPSEHDSDIGCMIQGRIEVSVVSCTNTSSRLYNITSWETKTAESNELTYSRRRIYQYYNIVAT